MGVKEAETHNARGLAAAKRGDHAAARKEFELARESDPENLEYDHNLGRTLIHLRELEEARRVLERNAKAREVKYGIDAVEYAIGLEALAEVQRELGELDLALDTIGEAIGIFYRARDLRMGSAVALEAEIAAERRKELSPYAELGDLPDAVVEAIATASIERCNAAPPERALVMLERLRGFLLERLGESHGATIRVLAGIANTHRELGHHEERIAALDALAASFECLGAVPEVVETLLARALAEVERGHSDRAVATHREALARAREIRDARLEAKVLRFLGFLQIDRSEIEAACDTLGAALRSAEAAHDSDQQGRAHAALGLALLYADRASEGRRHLDSASILLPPHDPEVEWVEAHAGAIDRASGRPKPAVSELVDAHARVRMAG